MSDEQSNQSSPNLTDIDPILTNDLDGVNPESPLIPANEYNLTVSKCELGKSEKSGNRMVKLQLKNLDPVTAVNGEAIPAGSHVIFHQIMITATEKRTNENIQRDLKRFQLACGVKSGPFMPLDQYVGKNLRAKVGMSKPSEDYPDPKNEIKSFVTG